MKKSKRTKSSKRNDGLDRISNLPDPIIHLILSRLPATEEVVRTSILSTRWRYLWTSISSLDIDCTRGLNPSKKFKKHKFKEFVYWVLLNKTLKLDSFRLCCMNHYKISTVWRWIHAAVMRNVKSLDLMFYPIYMSEDVELPHCVVTSESLEVLRLFLFRRTLSLPNFKGFSSLRVLELNSVELSDDDLVEEFFKSCLLLEDLNLIDCVINKLTDLCISCLNLKTLRIDNRKMDDGEESDFSCMNFYENEGLCIGLEISCPKLMYLEYAGHIAYDFYFDLDSLKKAVIYPEGMSQKELSFESLGDTICELFGGVSHVESLKLNRFFTQAIGAARDPEGDFPVFLPNLKTLEIATSLDAYTMIVVVRILKASPILECFHLTIHKENYWPESWELEEVLAHHLKRVVFLEFDGEKRKLDTARFLLKHGNELEEMVFSWIDKVKYDDKSMETLNEVSKFHKASSSVKIITLLNN